MPGGDIKICNLLSAHAQDRPWLFLFVAFDSSAIEPLPVSFMIPFS
jgi:hypothetical protein